MSGKSSQRMPQMVRVQITEVALKNLEGCGEHHVLGEDGTHVYLELVDGEESENASAEPKFKIVKKDREEGFLRRLFK